jgi:hypothetical protein
VQYDEVIKEVTQPVKQGESEAVLKDAQIVQDSPLEPTRDRERSEKDAELLPSEGKRGSVDENLFNLPVVKEKKKFLYASSPYSSASNIEGETKTLPTNVTNASKYGVCISFLM